MLQRAQQREKCLKITVMIVEVKARSGRVRTREIIRGWRLGRVKASVRARDRENIASVKR
jgi:hypothetical protein